MAADPDIVIVGAGAAGVAAARRLARSGLAVALLEAGTRVGGRAWTRELAGLPLDLGCGWLHSADRNPWSRIAESSGFKLDRNVAKWGVQHLDLGFSQADQAAAEQVFDNWTKRLVAAPPASDRASDALEPGNRWNPYLQAVSGFINGVALESVSVSDYLAYDDAYTGINWRVADGYGALVAASLPPRTDLRLATPVDAIALNRKGVALRTPRGTLQARAVIMTVSTGVLVGSALDLPSALDPWRQAATRLPLGKNEKLFLEIVGESPFLAETQVIGNPRDAATGGHYIRPFGWPLIETFLGGAGAQQIENEGSAAGFGHAIEELVTLFGSDIRRNLRPLAASSWSRDRRIGGAYSHALPGWSSERQALARPFDGRIFFAGEATERQDFSTAHGAYQSGTRAAEEAIDSLG